MDTEELEMAAVDKCLAWGHWSGHICWLFIGKHGYSDEVAWLQNSDLQQNDPQLERRIESQLKTQDSGGTMKKRNVYQSPGIVGTGKISAQLPCLSPPWSALILQGSTNWQRHRCGFSPCAFCQSDVTQFLVI